MQMRGRLLEAPNGSRPPLLYRISFLFRYANPSARNFRFPDISSGKVTFSYSLQ